MATNLDVATLRSFTLIAEGRTFADAADAVGRSQSAITLQIQRLEQEVGAPLFRRNRQSVELTIAGERLLGFAQRLVQINDEALVTMAPDAARSLGLGVTPDIAETILEQVLECFRQEHPVVDITLRIDGSRKLVEAVGREEIDIAIALNMDDSLNQGPLSEAQMLWIGRPGFTIRENNKPLPLAFFEPPCAFRTAALEALGSDIPYRIAATSPSLGGIIAAVRSGLCMTIRTKHLLGAGLVDVGQSMQLPSLPSVAFSCYTRIGEKRPERDDLIEICRRYLQ
ncbi:MAG: LysR substrate-binding domain-containing protein [Rhizobium sp.]